MIWQVPKIPMTPRRSKKQKAEVRETSFLLTRTYLGRRPSEIVPESAHWKSGLKGFPFRTPEHNRASPTSNRELAAYAR